MKIPSIISLLSFLLPLLHLGQSSEEMALKIRFRRGGKLQSTNGNKCTVDERNAFLRAMRSAMEEVVAPSHEETPWWCHGLCRHHDKGEYCAVVHPHCSFLKAGQQESSIDDADATAPRKLHENRMLPVKELGPQAHPSQLRRDRSTADQKTVCRGTRISFLTRVRDHLGTTVVSDECITFLKHRFDIACYAVQPEGAESAQLSSKPQEVMGGSNSNFQLP